MEEADFVPVCKVSDLPDPGKAVFEVEYQDQGGLSPSSFCPTANAYGFNSIQFTTPLDGTFRVPCR